MIFVKEKSMHLLCVVSCLLLEKCPEIVLKFSKKLVLNFYFVLLGPLNQSDWRLSWFRLVECEDAGDLVKDHMSVLTERAPDEDLMGLCQDGYSGVARLIQQ